MIKIINGIEYVSTDIAGKPVHFAANKNLSNKEKVIRIEYAIDGIPVLSIQDRAFRHSVNLQLVELPDSLFRIGSAAFYNCLELKKVQFYKAGVDTADSAVTLGFDAFGNCLNLVEIDTNKPLHLNGQNIFNNCISLQKLNNGNVVVGSIYAHDFYNCQNLKHVYVKGNHCRLWTDCFKGASHLDNIRFDCNFVQAPKAVLKQLAKMKIYCTRRCNLSELAYIGTNVYITD